MTDNNGLDTIKYQGNQYVVIDTVLPGDQSYYVDDFNGRQGDNLRRVNVCLKNHGEFWNLGNYKVNLVGRDADNVLKATQSAAIIKAARGLVRLAIPAEFYQATGEYTDAFLQIVDDNGTIISSVRVDFEVLYNGTLISKVESQLYLGQISEFIKAAQAQVDTISTDVKSVQQSATAINDLINTYLQTVKTNAAAVTGKDNQWTAKQTFNQGLETPSATVDNDMAVGGTITANKLAGQAMTDIMKAIAAIPVTTTNSVTRSYTCSDGVSKPGGSDDFLLQKTDFGSGVSLIVGSGNLNFNNPGNNAISRLQMPWAVGRGSGFVGTMYLYSKYAVRLDPENPGQINFSCSDAVSGTTWCSFILLTTR